MFAAGLNVALRVAVDHGVVETGSLLDIVLRAFQLASSEEHLVMPDAVLSLAKGIANGGHVASVWQDFVSTALTHPTRDQEEELRFPLAMGGKSPIAIWQMALAGYGKPELLRWAYVCGTARGLQHLNWFPLEQAFFPEDGVANALALVTLFSTFDSLPPLFASDTDQLLMAQQTTEGLLIGMQRAGVVRVVGDLAYAPLQIDDGYAPLTSSSSSDDDEDAPTARDEEALAEEVEAFMAKVGERERQSSGAHHRGKTIAEQLADIERGDSSRTRQRTTGCHGPSGHRQRTAGGRGTILQQLDDLEQGVERGRATGKTLVEQLEELERSVRGWKGRASTAGGPRATYSASETKRHTYSPAERLLARTTQPWLVGTPLEISLPYNESQLHSMLAEVHARAARSGQSEYGDRWQQFWAVFAVRQAAFYLMRSGQAAVGHVDAANSATNIIVHKPYITIQEACYYAWPGRKAGGPQPVSATQLSKLLTVEKIAVSNVRVFEEPGEYETAILDYERAKKAKSVART